VQVVEFEHVKQDVDWEAVHAQKVFTNNVLIRKKNKQNLMENVGFKKFVFFLEVIFWIKLNLFN
jgi:hypothetical protein